MSKTATGLHNALLLNKEGTGIIIIQAVSYHLQKMETHPQMIILSNNSQGEKQFFVNDIVFCQSDNAKVHVWFSDRGRFTVTSGLSSFEDVLKPYGFIRIQQSYLININHVEGVKRSEKRIIMKHFPNIVISASRENGHWNSFIAAWESRAIWPRKGLPEVKLSKGEYKIASTEILKLKKDSLK